MQQLDLFEALQLKVKNRRPNRQATRRKSVAPIAIDDGQWVAELGYDNACQRGPAGLCSVKAMFFTGAIVIGITRQGHGGRYCYASTDEAARALAAWDGSGDPPGDWIKFKGSSSERIGPGFTAPVR